MKVARGGRSNQSNHLTLDEKLKKTVIFNFACQPGAFLSGSDNVMVLFAFHPDTIVGLRLILWYL